MTKTRSGAAAQKRGQMLKLPEQCTAECADGESRANWKFDGQNVVCLVPPGTPIIACSSCGARVCQIKSGNGLAMLDYARGDGDETNDFYAPEHNCKLL